MGGWISDCSCFIWWLAFQNYLSEKTPKKNKQKNKQQQQINTEQDFFGFFNPTMISHRVAAKTRITIDSLRDVRARLISQTNRSCPCVYLVSCSMNKVARRI